MSEEEKSKGGIKFTDRRRFDDSGTLRTSDEAPQEAQSQTKTDMREPVGGAVSDEPELNFASFLVSLATQALMQMGQIPAPEGMDVPVNREAAKQTIDILEMLERKTKGNLDSAEARLIEEILYSVHMAFVKVKG